MNITRLNFKQTLPFIKECVQKSSFYAIDLEMTGISSSDRFKNNLLDSHQMRYWKNKNNVEKFLPVQLGLCGFEIVNQSKIIAYPFNFYIYPLTMNDSDDRVFSFSSGSMSFLAYNNFDFNKLFYEGIYFVSKEDQALYEGQYKAEQLKKALRKLDKIITPDMQAFENINKIKIIKWLKTEILSLGINIKLVRYRAYMHLIESIRDEHPNLTFYVVFDKNQPFRRQYMTLTKMLQFILFRRPESYQQPKPQSQEQSLQDHKQLSNVIHSISASKKPVVVHNGLLDLMHIYHKFFYKLPERVQSFKEKLHNTFPFVYDTKFIAANSPVLFNKVLKDTSLGNAYKHLSAQQNPRISISPQFKQYNLEENNTQGNTLHEAGYDALMTGICFLKEVAVLELISQVQSVDFNQKMVYFKNRIPIGNINIPFNLEELDDLYTSPILKVYHFLPVIYSGVRESDISEYFQKGFGKINIYWTSRYQFNFSITFQDSADEAKFQSMIQQNSGLALITINNITLMAYSQQKYEEYLKGIKKMETQDSI